MKHMPTLSKRKLVDSLGTKGNSPGTKYDSPDGETKLDNLTELHYLSNKGYYRLTMDFTKDVDQNVSTVYNTVFKV